MLAEQELKNLKLDDFVYIVNKHTFEVENCKVIAVKKYINGINLYYFNHTKHSIMSKFIYYNSNTLFLDKNDAEDDLEFLIEKELSKLSTASEIINRLFKITNTGYKSESEKRVIMKAINNFYKSNNIKRLDKKDK